MDEPKCHKPHIQRLTSWNGISFTVFSVYESEASIHCVQEARKNLNTNSVYRRSLRFNESTCECMNNCPLFTWVDDHIISIEDQRTVFKLRNHFLAKCCRLYFRHKGNSTTLITTTRMVSVISHYGIGHWHNASVTRNPEVSSILTHKTSSWTHVYFLQFPLRWSINQWLCCLTELSDRTC